MCKEDNDNAEQNANNCRNCGSIEEEEGDTHIHCADCGIPKDALADDDGFVPTNPNQTPYQHKSLGSFVGSKSDREIRHDRSMRRLSNLNGRVAHKKPTFLDGVLLELGAKRDITWSDVQWFDVHRRRLTEKPRSRKAATHSILMAV